VYNVNVILFVIDVM